LGNARNDIFVAGQNGGLLLYLKKPLEVNNHDNCEAYPLNTAPMLNIIVDDLLRKGKIFFSYRGNTITFTATATDVEDNGLEFGIKDIYYHEAYYSHSPKNVTANINAKINPDTGVFTWIPNETGTFYIAITVTETDGLPSNRLSDEDVIKIYVSDVIVKDEESEPPGFSYDLINPIPKSEGNNCACQTPLLSMTKTKLSTLFSNLLSSFISSGTFTLPNNLWWDNTDNIFVIIKHVVYHYNGSRWSSIYALDSEPYELLYYDYGDILYGIWGNSANDLFIVGEEGRILHYDGNNWMGMNNSTNKTLTAVWGASGNDVFAVGWDGTILHYDGSHWTKMNSGTKEALFGIWGTHGNNVFAVGVNGTILHYDGHKWTTMSSDTNQDILGILGCSGSDIYAVGNGIILHYDGIQWEKRGILEELWNFFKTTTFRKSYDLSDWSFIDKKSATSLTIMESNTDSNFSSVWVNSAKDVFAVGDGWHEGVIFHYDGKHWTEMLKDEISFSDIWGSSENNVFVVGDGIVFHYDGNQWTEMLKDNISFSDIWGSSENNVFVVGGNWHEGVIFHYDGKHWTEMFKSDIGPFHDVWGTTSNNVFATAGYGNNKTYFHYDGNHWTTITQKDMEEDHNPKSDVNSSSNFSHLNDDDWFSGIWGNAETNVLTIGMYDYDKYNDYPYYYHFSLYDDDLDTIFRYDGNQWTVVATGIGISLNDIMGVGDDVFMVGDHGTILHYDLSQEVTNSMPEIAGNDNYCEFSPNESPVNIEPISVVEDDTIPATTVNDDATPSTTGAAHTLIFTTQGNGKVTSTQDGIDCGVDCSEDYTNGTAVTVTAIPEKGSRFTGWGGKCSGIDTDSFTVTMNTAMNCSAIFAPLPSYTLTINKLGSGAGTVTTSQGSGIFCGTVCTESYYEGSTIILIATADDNSKFVQWAENGCAGSITMTKDLECKAVFNQLPPPASEPDLPPPAAEPDLPPDYSLKVITMGSGKGIVQSEPTGIDCGTDCEENYASNTIVTLTATLEAGTRFSSWQGNCQGNELSTTATMTANLQCKALFKSIPNRTLTVNQEGSGTGIVNASEGLNSGILDCTSTCSEDYSNESTIALTAIADSDSLFTGWSGDENCADSITITADMNCTATFELLPPPDDLEEDDLEEDDLEEEPTNRYKKETTIVTFEDKTVELPVLDEAKTVAINTEGEVIDTDAGFVGGISVEGEAFAEEAQPKSSDVLDVRSSIEVDSEHLGQPAEVLVVAAYQPDTPNTRSSKPAPVSFYMLVDTKGTVVPWDMNMASLIPLKTVAILDEAVEVPIYQGALGITGTVNLYVGYRAKDGTVIYSPDTLDINITE